jgi:hypothetical protein
VKKNGHYANGRQRWFCHICRRSFHWGVRSATHNREKIWFDRFIVEGYSIRQLSDQSGLNQKRLRRIVNYWLTKSPTQDISSLEGITNVIFDGTFIKHPKTAVALMDAATNTVLEGAYDVRENSRPELATFFLPLAKRGLSPVSFTTDGNPQVIQMLTRLWPNALIQRCLVHVQRQGLSWCRVNPKRADAKALRMIFLDVMSIRTKKERDQLLSRIRDWEEMYGEDIAKAPERGRVFSDVKRARSMLMRALPNMFHYLDHPAIPPTTNGLEGYFSRLKGHYRQHRGLSPEKRNAYFDWYFKLRPR